MGSMSSTVTAAQHYLEVGELMVEQNFVEELDLIVLVAVVHFVCLGLWKSARESTALCQVRDSTVVGAGSDVARIVQPQCWTSEDGLIAGAVGVELNGVHV